MDSRMHLQVPVPTFAYYLSPPDKFNSAGLVVYAFKIEEITVASPQVSRED